MPLSYCGTYTDIIDDRGVDIDHPTAVFTRTCCHTCMVVEIGTNMRIHWAHSADLEAQLLASEPWISVGISWILGGIFTPILRIIDKVLYSPPPPFPNFEHRPEGGGGGIFK